MPENVIYVEKYVTNYGIQGKISAFINKRRNTQILVFSFKNVGNYLNP